MSKPLIIGLIIVAIVVFSIAMYVVFSVVRKIQPWFEIEPLVEFTAEQIEREHEFSVEASGEYVFCVVVRRDLKLVRPPLYKIDFSILNKNRDTLNLKKGLTVFKQINGNNIREMNYILAEFEITKRGKYTVEVVSDKGVYSTDKFFIRPKLKLFN